MMKMMVLVSVALLRKEVRSHLFPVIQSSLCTKYIVLYRPLSRRLDRCNRIIQNKSTDQNGVIIRYLRAHARLSALLYTFTESLASLSIAMAFSR